MKGGRIMETIFELVQKILDWAGASEEAKSIVAEIFEWILGLFA